MDKSQLQRALFNMRHVSNSGETLIIVESSVDSRNIGRSIKKRLIEVLNGNEDKKQVAFT